MPWLIQKLRINEPNVKQVWFADNSSAAGKANAVRRWWSCLTIIVPKIGYYPNPSKTHLDEARNMFEGTGIKLYSIEGHGLLGSTVHTTKFGKEFVVDKVENFVEEMDILSKIAEMYPHMQLFLTGLLVNGDM